MEGTHNINEYIAINLLLLLLCDCACLILDSLLDLFPSLFFLSLLHDYISIHVSMAFHCLAAIFVLRSFLTQLHSKDFS